jgi:hypothetical protein
MACMLYTAFDIVPGPQRTSTHILHNIRGLVNSYYPVYLMTPNDGCSRRRMRSRARLSHGFHRTFLARAAHLAKAVFAHHTRHPDYNGVQYRNIWAGLFVAKNKRCFGNQALRVFVIPFRGL